MPMVGAMAILSGPCWQASVDSVETIASVAREHGLGHLRQAALVILARMDIVRAFATLKIVVESDQSPRVRREAVEEMAHLPQQLAVPYLLELAEAERDQPVEMRREAIESLSGFDASLMASRLNQLAWSDSSQAVREEAIESLADLNDGAANSMLLELTRNHPRRHTSREALDRLQKNFF